MDGVSFCRRWNFDYHTPIDPMTVAEARQCDRAGTMYSVALGDPGDGAVPEAVVEIVWEDDFAGVWFCDEHGRQALNYAFRRMEGRLFLFDMIEYTYPDDQAETLAGAVRTEQLMFSPDGLVKQIITDDVAQERTTVEYSDVEVTTHWEPVPAFGDWASLTRWDRDGES